MRDVELELEAELEDLMATLGESDLESEAERFAPSTSFGTGQSRRDLDQWVIGFHLSQGVLDENRLTDAVFFDRHPERQGRLLGRTEWAPRREWLAIRDGLVRPMLGQAPVRKQPARSAAPSSPMPTSGGDVGSAPVPGMPGVTIAQLIEQYRSAIAPEIPLTVLLAFIHYESGGNFSDATHGSPRNRIPFTSPAFYELGLFQTPAGLHGGCTTGNYKSCVHRPPGIENPADPSPWVRYCKQIGANPEDWQNPVTQVRVGLLDLETSAGVIRKRNRDLFSAPGTDWDLRTAVLLPFAGGGGYTQGILNRHRTDLASLPEDRSWGFLRSKIRADLAANIDKKMLLAAKLGYRA